MSSAFQAFPAAASYDAFISYNWADKAGVASYDKELTGAGINVCIDYRHLRPGGRWLAELPAAIRGSGTVVVFYGPEGYGRTQSKEIELSLAADKKIIPVILPAVRENVDLPLDFVALHTWVDLRRDPMERLIEALRPHAGLPEARLANPYRGLVYFREEDSRFFFGREQKTRELEAQLRSQRFVAVTGPSGNGKSSLLRAGLAQRLRASDEEWEILAMVPSREPWLELGRALAPVLYPAEDLLVKARQMGTALANQEMKLRDYARELERQGHRTLLIVDQFEELYTLAETPPKAFIDELLDTPELHIVLAYRGDFHDRVTGHNGLAERLNAGAAFNLARMEAIDLRAAVAEPARLLGRPLDSAVVNQILSDSGEEPGTLPLVEFVLRQLWERPEMDLDAYHELGGLHGALARHADGVLRDLTETEREAARRIFLQVVRPAEGGGDTRRRATKAEMGEADWAVAYKLSEHPRRLLVAGNLNGEETVEVAHEALVRSWQTLSKWLDEAREFLLWRERFRVHLEEWKKRPGDDGWLRGAQLEEAERWKSEPLLGDEGRRYIEGSALRAAAEVKRKRQATRRLWMLSGVLAMALAAVLVFFLQARTERAAAEMARAKSQKLVDYMVFDLRDAIEPYVPTAVRNEVNRRIADYQATVGSGGDANREHSRAAQLTAQGEVQQAQGDLQAALGSYQAGLAIAEKLARQNPGNAQWQRDLSVSHDNIGDVQQAQGDLQAALGSYQAELGIAEKLARQDPGNAGWQRDLSVSHSKIGDVQQGQGDLKAALESYQADLAIAEKLARQDPRNAEWQRNLAISHDNIGDVQQGQGDLKAALGSYQAALAIREKLARQDPGDAEWQRDLSISHDRIGEAQQAQGDLKAALGSYQADLAIAEKLARQDPGNAQWQRDLSISHNNIGDVQQAQGDLKAALGSYQACLAIREKLARQDPGNAQWQRDVSVSHNRSGDVQQTQGDLKAALASYQAGMAIAEKLARQDPGNAQWQRDLYVSHLKLAALLLTQSDSAGARPHADEALAIADRLVRLDPTNSMWQSDLKAARLLMKRFR